MNKIAGFIGLFAAVGNAITGMSIAGAAVYIAWKLTPVVVRYWNRWLTDEEFAATQHEQEATVG